MASFKPRNANNKSSSNNSNEFQNFPTPKKGARQARVSLIIDLGTQEREDFEDQKTGEKRPQKPCQQVVVFADLVRDVVDYGGAIGKAQYRLLLNKSFAGDVQGINFTATPPKDAKGNLIPNKPWSLHPASLLTKLAKATGQVDVIESMEIDKLLGQQFIAQVDVTEKESDKEDADGNPIVYKYVNFKGASNVPLSVQEDEEGNEIEVETVVPALTAEPLCITFDNAKPEHIKFIRGNLINKIKLATDYAGSKMQKAIEAYEADPEAFGGFAKSAPKDESSAEESQQEKPAKKASAAKKAPVQTTVEDDSECPY